MINESVFIGEDPEDLDNMSSSLGNKHYILFIYF